MIKINSDFSPYRLNFSHEGLEKVLSLFEGRRFVLPEGRRFLREVVPRDLAQQVIDLVPGSKELKLSPDQVAIFITAPGKYYPPHKDGLGLRYGINYPLQVLDDSCVTSWYTDEELSCYSRDETETRSREIVGFKSGIHVPIHSFVAKRGEAILFNTDLYHDFDNSKSTHVRALLALRNLTGMKYDRARSILESFT